jgi:hypothetical protein
VEQASCLHYKNQNQGLVEQASCLHYKNQNQGRHAGLPLQPTAWFLSVPLSSGQLVQPTVKGLKKTSCIAVLSVLLSLSKGLFFRK